VGVANKHLGGGVMTPELTPPAEGDEMALAKQASHDAEERLGHALCALHSAQSEVTRLSAEITRLRRVVEIMARFDHSTAEKVRIAREALAQPEKADDADD
jgi:hypothetical protein